jgi:hypothetical protein
MARNLLKLRRKPMQFDNQKNRNVADVVAKILAAESAEQEPQMLGEELKGNQHKIDANKNNKIDAHDFKLLRAKNKMKEESEQEETILEYESKEGVYRHKGTYGYEGKGAEHGQTDYKEKEKEEKPKKGYGARQNYVRSKKVSGKTYESFTAMMDEYKEQGIKGIFESLRAKKVEVIDMTDPYDIEKTEIELNQEEVEQVEERTLTEPEMNKREEVVKSMKKNLSGFKDRYGDKAKSVMYATATKIAKKD